MVRERRKAFLLQRARSPARTSEYVKNIEPKVILIDGKQLAIYMIDFSVGVDLMASYDVKKLQSDYFDEE